MTADIDPTAWAFETKQVHAGQTPDTATGARALPIYQTTSYAFRRHRPRRRAVRPRRAGQHLHPHHEPHPGRGRAAHRRPRRRCRRAVPVIGAGRGDASRSSTSPVPVTTSSLSPRLYGGTYNLFHYTLPKLGIETTFVDDPDDLDSWRAAVRPNTKAFFAETISNPQIDILDIPGVVRGGARERRAADRRQHHRDAVPDPADRARRRHRRALGDQVPRRPRHGDRGRDRRQRQLRLDAGPPSRLHQPGPQLPRRGVRRARPARLRTQGPRAAAARPRLGGRAVQRVPGRAGPRDAEPAHRAARRQRTEGRRVPRRP